MSFPEDSPLDNVERIQMYRLAISKFLKDDVKVAHRLLNIIRGDKSLNNEMVEELLNSLFENRLSDSDWFVIRFSDSLSHFNDDQNYELLKGFIDQTSDPSNSSVTRILKLCHGKLFDFFQRGEFAKASLWSELVLKLASVIDNRVLYNHFLDLYVRSLYANADNQAQSIEALYLEQKKKGHSNLFLSYIYLLQSFKNHQESKESVQNVLQDIVQSKEPKSEGIIKLALYEILQLAIHKEKKDLESEDKLTKLDFAIHLMKEIIELPLTSTFASRRVYLYQYMTQLMVTSIEISPLEKKQSKVEELKRFLKEMNISDCLDDEVRTWFEQVLFNLGLSLASDDLTRISFDLLFLGGVSLFKNRASMNQTFICLAGLNLGLKLSLVEESEILVNKALMVVESLSEDTLASVPNVLSTIYLKRVQIALRFPTESLKKIMKIIDDCLQEPRLPGETMEYMASMLKSAGRPFRRPRIRCLKSALNKPGINRNDINHGIHIFIELFKELLTPSYDETLMLPEIKSILNKLIERLGDVTEMDSNFQDYLLQILGQLWNYSWKLELTDRDSPYGKVLRDMSSSLQPFIPNHKEYLMFKLKDYSSTTIKETK